MTVAGFARQCASVATRSWACRRETREASTLRDAPTRVSLEANAKDTGELLIDVIGMAVYTARAVLQGKGEDVWEMVVENIS